MWLPTRVYELLPTLYIVAGQAFLAGSLYISSYSKLAPMYFVLGVVSVLSGLFVSQRRLHKRRNGEPSEDNCQA
jgi:hypothetical protein